MSNFMATWTRDGVEIVVVVVGFTEGDAVVMLPDGSLDRARLRDLRGVDALPAMQEARG